eukprot:Em0749g1a
MVSEIVLINIGDDEDCAVLNVDLKNAFNLVSRQAFLDECAFVYPNLLPWAFWCYRVHPILWHPMGHLSSESGVQQGADDERLDQLYQAWYMDDGVLAVSFKAFLCSIHCLFLFFWVCGIGQFSPYASSCPLLMGWSLQVIQLQPYLSTLDPLGHHAATCKCGGDAVLRHNKLRDILVESFHLAHIHVQVEAGSGLSHDCSHSWPADILVLRDH